MRLLLCIAVVQLPLLAIAWTIPFFSSPKNNQIYLYPGSPKEADPEAIRIKRQAYQVYVGGDISVTVDKSGQAETGVWGAWVSDQDCSRTCGGGVQIERRQCNGECTGPSVRYVSCNTEDCPPGSKDFRALQCASNDDTPLDGNYYKWLPYPGKNKCELTCKPDNANFYYKWADKVVDGTKCDTSKDDICVDGICLPVGCDKKLGSAVKDDKCAVCGGDGSTCKTIEGFFDERNLTPGYHNIIRLPVGATSIRIEEMRPTTNSLAVKNATGHYYLNGNYQIQVVDKDIEIGGTIFEYDNHKLRGTDTFERLIAKGPTTEELTIALLFQSGNKDSAIKYEFSVPLEKDTPYMYKPGEWSSCSVTCGKGVQTRTPYCVETETGGRVGDELCDENNSTKPESEKDCETVDCEPEWYQGKWEPCSETCGSTGTQYRVVYCHSVFADGKRMTIDDANCTTERPPVQQSCNRFSCPEWHAGPWSACSEKCGDAFQYRSVACRSEKEGEEGKLLPAEACGELTIEDKRNCNLGPCEGLMFFTSEWNLCQKCNDTEETRNVTCKDRSGRAYPLEKCLNENSTEIPIDIRSCATPPPCIYEWHSSEWSKCSTECGHGHQNRRVVCAIHELGDLTVVDESHCNANSKPPITKNCTNEEKCNGTYYTGPWTQCTAECGGGTQKRMIVCLNYDKKPVPEWCDEAVKPPEEQECNTQDCPTCEDGEFGCCPDNSTYALGPYLEGCSNCSSSEFGCCADNVTDATGPGGKGCPDYIELEEASGEEEMPSEKKEEEEKGEEEMCEVKNEETGEMASVECKVGIMNVTLDEDEELMGNDTADNITIHCSKTEFGCCPDWTTPADGKNNEGCPTFIQGACNETANGCCPDEVTMARGPNFEGCGEPSCAASLYGCCKDRKTIAFGPHYAGCERSSFPCELSTFGCCPDGETAALGTNGTGCGADCLVSKYGCCPDGITQSKGLNNEGCGCQYAQFGCCPDGKSAAKGPGYYGCPETCAQSQYGCCPDGKTISRGPRKEGCPCQYTHFGCCPDGETAAMGPRNEGCDDCRYAKYGCCPDGETRAIGPNYIGCPSTTVAPFLLGGTVAPERIAACSLPQDQGNVCHPGYKLVWFYDTAEGRCSQFWYGGCEGNDNRFATKEQCETICVEPPARGRCYLPKMEGPIRCTQLSARYWYDYTTRQCGAFWWRGCLGNANNFETWEECQTFCSGIGPVETTTTTHAPPPMPPRFEVSTPAPESQVQPQPQPYRHEAESEQQYPQRQQFHLHSMEEICRMTVDSGPCANYEDMFYYDAFSGKCHPFIYGGCGGNLNKYKTKEECEARCTRFGADRSEDQVPMPDRLYGGPRPLEPVQVAPIPVDQASRTRHPIAPVIFEPPSSRGMSLPKSRDACNERMDVGRCQGSFESYYYEKATGTCQSFRYSGCGGNANRFHSKEQCEELCMRPAFVPPLIGHAAAGRVTSYSPMHGAQSAAADTSDADRDQQQTMHQCEQPKDTGPCDRFVTKWYYNNADGTCNRFHYGGCEGTANRFDSESQCKAACGDYADACSLPKVTGPCSGKHQRFYYDQITRRCERFEFGGCLGNSNNFVHLADCEQRCAKPLAMESLRLRDETRRPFECNLPKDVGLCRASIEQYYYDVYNGQCALFIYGGCGGNDNRFDTIEDCRRTCADYSYDHKHVSETLPKPINSDRLPKSLPQIGNEIDEEDDDYSDSNESAQDENEGKGAVLITEKDGNVYDHRYEQTIDDIPLEKALRPMPSSPLPELCQLPEDVGPCFGEMVRWRYDSEKLACVTFTYTGCGHNANYFTSEEACERACGSFRDQDICSMGVERGGCQLHLTKWYYDKGTGECHVFMYSGCEGNGNRFSSKAECEHLCTTETRVSHDGGDDVCVMERDSGPCTDPITQWYFDPIQQVCKQFTYGGCRGNGNRFDTKAQCEKRCSPRLQDLVAINSERVCVLPFEAGRCRESLQKWYFDNTTGYCRMFVYSGCDGNENRFDTKNECMHACSSLASKHAMDNRASVSLVGHVPRIAGSIIELKCTTRGQHPIKWFKDGRALDYEIENDPRIQVTDLGAQMTILDTRGSDSGDYSCAAGWAAILSDPVKVIIKAVEIPDTCIDKGNQMTCRLIIKTGLCANARYGKFCCRTCAESGFRM